MSRNILLAALALGAASASAQSTYTTTTGTVNLVAGLTTLTDTSAINSGATATQLGYITDGSWSTTGILNIGTSVPGGANPYGSANPNGGALAGTFGGGTFSASAYSVIIIGASGSTPAWNEFDVSLLLSTGVYSQTRHYTNADVTSNPAVATDAGFVTYNSAYNSDVGLGGIGTAYLLLSIADFDTGNVGVTGIKLSNINPLVLAGSFPDLNYIGVVGPSGGGPIPEPSTYGLALGGLALVGAVIRRRRSK